MVFRVVVAAVWLGAIGLTGVFFQLSRVRMGYRIQRAEAELERSRQRLREARVRYNRQVSPDVLERRVHEFLEGRSRLEI